MVGEVEHDGILGEACLLEFEEEVGDLLVEEGDCVVVACPVFADFRGIGVVGGELDEVGWDAGGCGESALLSVFEEGGVLDLAFVGGGEVKDGEEGLVWLAVAVVGGGAGVIPGRVGFAGDIVVGFGVVGAVVAGGFEVGGVGLEVRGDGNF